MSIWAFISLLNAIIAILLGAFVYSINKHGAVNRIFAIMCAGLANWGFAEFMLRQSQTRDAAAMWVRGNFTWALAPAALLHFVLIFTHLWKPKHKKMLLIGVYGTVPIIAYLELFTDLLSAGPVFRFWGYTYLPNNNNWVYWAVNLWGLSIAVFATIMCWRYWFRLEHGKSRRRARLIAVAVSLPVFTALLSEIVWPYMGIKLPELTTLSFSWLAMIAVYAIWRYELFYINPASAAEQIIGTMSDPLWLIDKDGIIVSSNRAAEAITGYSQNELHNKHIASLFDPQDIGCSQIRDTISRLETIQNDEINLLTAGNTVVPVLFTSTALKDNEQMIGGYVCIAHDISRRKQAMDQIAAEKERLMVTLQSIGDGVIATDTQGRIQLMNRVAEDITGWEFTEAAHKDFREVMKLINKKTGEQFRVSLDTIKPKDVPHGLGKDTVLIDRNGQEHYLSNSTAPITKEDGTIIGYVLAFRDITRRKQMENEVLKGQKLEAIGLLAGGIAHDFNNLLTGVLGNLELIKMQLNCGGDELLQMVADADRAAKRAKDLTQQLLTFAKGGTPITKTADIGELIKESSTFILRGTKVKCSFSIPENIRPVEIDKGQINQVINNLMINAQQAMPQGGTIQVSAINTDHKTEIPLSTGQYVKISIQDEGVGIPKKYLANIFDPYFTTKQNGNGLGLATTFSIIRKHKGHITVDSEPGAGTVFDIYLPASDQPIENTRQFVKPAAADKGRILLMDDDEIVQAVTGKMLEVSGFEVCIARDGEEALTLYEEAMHTDQAIDIVIADLTIPGGMGGKETIPRLLKLDPQVKAIVGSGYSNDPVMAEYEEHGFKACVAKPYTINELIGTIHKVMEQRADCD